MKIDFYNNIAINSFAIHSVLHEKRQLIISEVSLILPIITHKDMLNSIRRYNQPINFIEYFINNIEFFYNFAERYEDTIISTINSLQLLNEVGVIKIDGDIIVLKKPLPAIKNIGNRAKIIRQASQKLSILISDDVKAFYLQARILL